MTAGIFPSKGKAGIEIISAGISVICSTSQAKPLITTDGTTLLGRGR